MDLTIVITGTAFLTIAGFLLKFYINSMQTERDVKSNNDRIDFLQKEIERIPLMKMEVDNLKIEVEKTDRKISQMTAEIKDMTSILHRLDTKISILLENRII